MTQLERLELAAKSNSFSDDEVERIFLAIELDPGERAAREASDKAVDILAKWRPTVLHNILKKYPIRVAQSK